MLWVLDADAMTRRKRIVTTIEIVRTNSYKEMGNVCVCVCKQYDKKMQAKIMWRSIKLIVKFCSLKWLSTSEQTKRWLRSRPPPHRHWLINKHAYDKRVHAFSKRTTVSGPNKLNFISLWPVVDDDTPDSYPVAPSLSSPDRRFYR